MVTVTNGYNTFIVPSGSVGVYKRNGFKVVNENISKEPSTKSNVSITNQDDIDSGFDNDDEPQELTEEDAIFISAVEEKPISQWSNNDIRKYAEINGIDISTTKSAKEARAIIKKYFDSRSRSEM